jgi:hypothetical protein
MGSYSLEEYRRWIAPGAAGAGRKTLAWLVAAAPGYLVNSLAVLYCIFFYGNNRIPRYNLSNSRFSLTGRRTRTAG